MTLQRPRGHRWPSRFFVGAALLCATLGAASGASAATARVTWLPRAGASSYSVYIRNAFAPYGTAAPAWTGNPTPGSDGSLSATFTYTPASSGTNYFAVVATSANGESGLSTELPIGNVNPCRNDSCTTKTACDFSNQQNGLSCDDGIYCNGPEACLSGVCDTSASRNCADAVSCTVDACDEANGRCTHSAPPGCCLACDSGDPCLADACAQGDCTATAGEPIVVNRLRLLSKKSGIKLAAKGSFLADAALDPTQTGVEFELRAPDGALVYVSSIAAGDIRAGSTGDRFRFTASRADDTPQGNGLTRLDFRYKHEQWLVTAKGETPELIDAFLEPTLTWVIKFGDAACIRRMDLACAQTSAASICR
jgi:hypothetical protein